MAEARRKLRGLHVLFAGFSPDAGVPSPMVNPRVRALMKSPRPDFEWHSGELETALILARRPDLVRQKLVRKLPPAWVDFQAALARGARRFEDIAPGGAGYFGWPAAARARTAERAMRLRAELIARALLVELRGFKSSSKRPGRGRAGNAPSRAGGALLGAR